MFCWYYNSFKCIFVQKIGFCSWDSAFNFNLLVWSVHVKFPTLWIIKTKQNKISFINVSSMYFLQYGFSILLHPLSCLIWWYCSLTAFFLTLLFVSTYQHLVTNLFQTHITFTVSLICLHSDNIGNESFAFCIMTAVVFWLQPSLPTIQPPFTNKMDSTLSVCLS